MADEKEFKVNDRRHSSPTAPESKKQEGEGFTMSEKDQAGGPHEIDFSTFIFSLATGALISMGLAPDPVTKKVQKNLDLARQNIELLSVLKEKTKGNLTPDENQLLESLLTEVRLRFVDASKGKA